MTRRGLDKTKLWVGCSYLLKNIPLGSLVSNIELIPGLGGQLARAAGMCWQVSQIKEQEVILRSYGGGKHKIIKVSSLCLATLGQISNINFKLIILGKAGASRWIGKRPKVRGKAQNPVDHPLGGSTRGGKYIKNVWGRLVK
jgi:large subunit ribosomal protein L2